MLKVHILKLSNLLNGYESIIHPVLIQSNKGNILFDTGYPDQESLIIGELKHLGFDITDIDKIIISHHDHDHIGSLNALVELNPKIKVMANPIEADFIRRKIKAPRLIQAEEYAENLFGSDKEFGLEFIRYLNSIGPCNIDTHVKGDESIIPGLKVINTFGHSPGHISLLIEDQCLLLAGDSLAIENSRLVIANPQFTLNMNDAIKGTSKNGVKNSC